MAKTIAFLRAINVGGRNVTMASLSSLFEELGLVSVETFIASGNIIFETDLPPDAELAAAIATHLETSLGYEVATFLRTDAEVAAIAADLPFPADALARAQALNVGFLASPLTPEEVTRLDDFATDIDAFATRGRELYWLCRRRQSDSSFNNKAFESALGRRATFRSLNTVARLAAKYPPG